MSTQPIGSGGRAYRKHRIRRSIHEALGSYRYSTPALDNLDRNLEEHIVPNLGEQPGFFIEAGANDGFDQSNTYYLARRYKWSGILIEPIPELAAISKKVRRESLTLSCALGPTEAEGTTLSLHRAGLMSTVEGGRSDLLEHLQRAKDLQPGAQSGVIKVPVRALSSIIDEHAPGRCIDLLSLDVEGYEPQVLAGIDFDRHAPRFICVEVNDSDSIHAMLGDRYDMLAQLSHHDCLYRLNA